jgi:alpha-galactosidase/6-phospho-beta-glucosidase family protein
MSSRSLLKIAYLGGGSRQWARALMRDLALSEHFDGELVLFDLNAAAARKNVSVGQDIFSRPDARSKLRVRAADTLAEALRAADVVVISTEPGPVTMRYADLVIPARHGILQTVGDTTGPGGLLRAMRALPDYFEFGEAIANHCPHAWVINYTNPMTLCTAALHAAFPAIRAFGCCHEVLGVRERLAKDVARWLRVATPTREDIEVEIAGVNHFTWATAARWQGIDLFPHLAQDATQPSAKRNLSTLARKNHAREAWFDSPGAVALDLFRRYGALGAAGERHLVEFLPEYLTDERTLHRWGVVATPYAWRLRHRQGPDDSLTTLRNQPLKPSGEEGVRLLEALFGHGEFVTSVNLPNVGQMPGLAHGAIVETNARFSASRITPLVPRRLSAAAESRVRLVSEVQAQVLHAARTRDIDAAFNALIADPLCRVSIDEAAKLFSAMVTHAQGHLRGWKLPPTRGKSPRKSASGRSPAPTSV